MLTRRKKNAIIKVGEFDCEKLPTIGDGNCLFHAIIQAVYSKYKDMHSRSRFISDMRMELSKVFPVIYPQLMGGHVKDFALSVPEFSLKNMQAVLNTDRVMLGYCYLHFLSIVFEISIYVVTAEGKLYQSDENNYCISDFPGIVILHEHEHFSTLSYNGFTLFDKNHPLLLHLKEQI